MTRRNVLHAVGATSIGAAFPSMLPAETMIGEFVSHWRISREYTLSMLDAMPSEHFDFKPTPEQMNFGKQFTHIGYFNMFLLGMTKNKPAIPEPEDTSRESSRRYLIETFDFCDTLLSELSEQDLSAKGSNRPDWLADRTNRELLQRAYIHTSHHRGQAVVYLRLNGIKPPQFRV